MLKLASSITSHMANFLLLTAQANLNYNFALELIRDQWDRKVESCQ